MTSDSIQNVNVLGTKIAVFNLETAVEQVCTWLSEPSTGRYICVTGVHGVMESLNRPDVRKAHNSADACVPDGMPMTWIGRLNGFSTIDRVYGPDLMLRLLDLSARQGFTNYFYGGAEGVADDLKLRMVERYPGLNVVGTFCPPFRALEPQEKLEIIRDINTSKADLLWIGLGTPKQELFMAEFHESINSKVSIGVGAAFDFHTGRVSQAPRWMMRAGLEWFYRLCAEPRRLGPRYLKIIPTFLGHIILQQSRLRQYPIT